MGFTGHAVQGVTQCPKAGMLEQMPCLTASSAVLVAGRWRPLEGSVCLLYANAAAHNTASATSWPHARPDKGAAAAAAATTLAAFAPRLSFTAREQL